MKWPSRCHVLNCEEIATHTTLFDSRICDEHFSAYYSSEQSCLMEGTPGETLPLAAWAYWRHVKRCGVRWCSRSWWAARPRQIRLSIWMKWHRVWFPIRWHVPSWWGWLRGWRCCNHCDRYIVRVLDKRGIWICDGCRERTYDHATAGFGGDFGRNQACITCGAAADCEIAQQPYCHAHGYEALYGEPYVQPSEEEIAAHRALCEAMAELTDEDQGPPMTRTNRMTAVTMDRPYLERLFARVSDKFQRKGLE